MKIPLMIFSIGIGIIGSVSAVAEEIDSEFGEYASPGNVWVEITHSAADPPIWSIWKGLYLKQYQPDQYKDIASDLDLAKKFYEQYDITILDLIESNNDAQVCEAIGCLFGTYHLLVPENDDKKFQNTDFRYMVFKSIPPKKQQGIEIIHGKIFCKQELELIFKYDNSPACVKPSTAQKLLERGWTMLGNT